MMRVPFRQLPFAFGCCAMLSFAWASATTTQHAPSKASAPSDRTAFLDWARRASIPLSADLRPLGAMIGDTPIVALSEGLHGAAEPLEVRNQVLQYLIEEKGFTAIAIESGIVESRLLHDYVRGGPGDLQTVVTQGVSWTFDQLPQNAQMVRWIRNYNADARHTRKINLYGFDVPGSPGNPKANRGVETALTETLRYVNRVDRAAAAPIHARLAPLLKNLRFALSRPSDAPGYDRYTSDERDALTGIIADVITLMERREVAYVAASSADDYEWAYRAALGARQVDSWLRHTPLGWQASQTPPVWPSEHVSFVYAASDARDRAQADNLDWIIRREGPSGKILVFAHRYHISAAPVKVNAHSPDIKWHYEQQVAGTYLRRRLGERYLTIGNFVGKGNGLCAGFPQHLNPGPPESMDEIAGEAGLPRFLLDLRRAPPDAASWLDREQLIGWDKQLTKQSIGRGFDILLYLDVVTPACRE